MSPCRHFKNKLLPAPFGPITMVTPRVLEDTEIEFKRSVLLSLKHRFVTSISGVSDITFLHRECFDDHDEGVDQEGDG